MPDISNDLKTQKNKLEQKDPWVYLCEIELPEGWYRVTNHVSNVTWRSGQVWFAFPLLVSSVKYSSKGEVPTATVTISNVGNALMPYMTQNKGLIGKQGNLYLVNLLFLNDPIYSVIPEKFTIVASSSTPEVIVFNLSLSVDAYGIEGPIQSYDRDKFPGMPIVNPRVSIGVM